MKFVGASLYCAGVLCMWSVQSSVEEEGWGIPAVKEQCTYAWGTM